MHSITKCGRYVINQTLETVHLKYSLFPLNSRGGLLLDQKDVSNIGDEFERGLMAYKGAFSKVQRKALRTAFEMAIMNTCITLQGRLK